MIQCPMESVKARQNVGKWLVEGKEYPVVDRKGQNIIVKCEQDFVLGFDKSRFSEENNFQIVFDIKKSLFGKEHVKRRHPKEKVILKLSRKKKRNSISGIDSKRIKIFLNPEE